MPEPPAPAAEPSVTTSAPTKPSVAESSATQKTSDANTFQGAAAIPIPAPKRRLSVSTPIPRPTASRPTTPQPTPPASTTEPTPVSVPAPSKPAESNGRSQEDVNKDASQESTANCNETVITPAPRRPSTSATETRPSKRIKTNAEPAGPVTESQPEIAQPLTPPATQTESEDTATTGVHEETETRPAPAEKGRKITKPRNKRSSRNGPTENENGNERRKRPRARPKREPTPEGAENIEIAPTSMKMSDLCKDLRTGKMSKREIELRNMELAEQERKQKTQQDGGEAEQTPVKQNADAAPSTAEQDEGNPDKSQGGQAGPVMRIVNGEIVLDTASLQVDRHADAERDMGELEDVVENSLTRKINQASYGKRSKTESWDEEMTDLFYRGLRMFGTDFMMISKMFPGRSRRQIKLKFNNEERRNSERIKDTLLGPSESVDIETYSEMTNTIYDDPKAIQQELDEEKKQIEDQHAKEKAVQEDLLHNPDGTGDGKTGPADKNNSATGKGKSRNNKKQASKNQAGGTEEVVGSIDDFP